MSVSRTLKVHDSCRGKSLVAVQVGVPATGHSEWGPGRMSDAYLGEKGSISFVWADRAYSLNGETSGDRQFLLFDFLRKQTLNMVKSFQFRLWLNNRVSRCEPCFNCQIATVRNYQWSTLLVRLDFPHPKVPPTCPITNVIINDMAAADVPCFLKSDSRNRYQEVLAPDNLEI